MAIVNKLGLCKDCGKISEPVVYDVHSGQTFCLECVDERSRALAPFDPNARAYQRRVAHASSREAKSKRQGKRR